MKCELRLSGDDDAHIIRNLWPLYQHELSEFDGSTPNSHGLFGVDDDVTTLAKHAEKQDPWWREPEALFPYLVLADGCPAGFNLVAARSRLADEIDADFVVHEFFVLHAYRGEGVAERAAVEGFDRHRGKWEVVTYPTHARAIAFWRRVLGNYASGEYSENEVDHAWGRKVAFSFQNDRGPSGQSLQTDRAAPGR